MKDDNDYLGPCGNSGEDQNFGRFITVNQIYRLICEDRYGNLYMLTEVFMTPGEAYKFDTKHNKRFIVKQLIDGMFEL